MSIRDLPDSPPPPRRRKPLLPSPPPFGTATCDPWAMSFPEDRTDEGRPYRVRSEDVWSAARDAYLAGEAAEAVCARFDLGVSAFRQRARREGWRRSDAEDAPPEPLGFPVEPEPAPPTPELVDLAWRSAAQAVRRRRCGAGGSMKRAPGCGWWTS